MPEDQERQTSKEASTSQEFKPSAHELVIGSITGLDSRGQALVDFPQNGLGKPMEALATVGVTQQHVGRQVALLFANGDPQQPVIIGIIHSPLHEMLASYELSAPSDSAPDAAEGVQDVVVDGRRIVIEGREEVVLKCGDASITLTKSGKILIRGKYLVNRSSGVNRIMGGSVQIN